MKKTIFFGLIIILWGLTASVSWAAKEIYKGLGGQDYLVVNPYQLSKKKEVERFYKKWGNIGKRVYVENKKLIFPCQDSILSQPRYYVDFDMDGIRLCLNKEKRRKDIKILRNFDYGNEKIAIYGILKRKPNLEFDYEWPPSTNITYTYYIEVHKVVKLMRPKAKQPIKDKGVELFGRTDSGIQATVYFWGKSSSQWMDWSGYWTGSLQLYNGGNLPIKFNYFADEFKIVMKDGKEYIVEVKRDEYFSYPDYINPGGHTTIWFKAISSVPSKDIDYFLVVVNYGRTIISLKPVEKIAETEGSTEKK